MTLVQSKDRPARFSTVVLLVLSAALTGTGCGNRSPLPEGAEVIPADATFALSIDLPAILNSELYKRLESDERFFGRNRLNFYRFAEATGLDPSKDITRLLLVARAGNQGLEEMSGLVVGNFDGRKVRDFLVSSGLPSHKVGQTDIFEMVIINDKCLFCLAVVDAGTAAFGDGDTLAKIAQVKAGEVPGLADQEGPGRLLRRVGRSPEAWGIVRTADFKEKISEMLSQVSAGGSALAALGPIREIAFSFDTTEPLRLLLEMTTSSHEDALRVADVLKGAESLGRLALKEARPEFGVLLSDLLIEADTGIVRAVGTLPSSDLEMAARTLGLGWPPGADAIAGAISGEKPPEAPPPAQAEVE